MLTQQSRSASRITQAAETWPAVFANPRYDPHIFEFNFTAYPT